MLPTEELDTRTTNRHAIISLILGIVTLLIFCGGILIPIPLTSVICVPVSALIGFAGLIYGIVSLNRIRKHNQKGHPMAWTGIVIGGFVILCMVCAMATFIVLFQYFPGMLDVPPFLKDFHF